MPIWHASIRSARRLPPHDAQRIQRALEVWQLCGQPSSSLHGRRSPPALELPLIALLPADRGWLRARIAARFD